MRKNNWKTLRLEVTSHRLLEKEVRQRKQMEQRLALQYFTSEGLAQAESIPTGVQFSLQLVCQSQGWPFVAYWEVDNHDQALRCIGIWTDQEKRFKEFSKVLKTSPLPLGIDLPGAAWASGEAVFRHDFVSVSPSPHDSHAAKTGFRAGFALPVHVEDRCSGVLEFLDEEPLAPTPGQLQMLAAVGIQIGSFIKRKRNEQELRIRQALCPERPGLEDSRPQNGLLRKEGRCPTNQNFIDLHVAKIFAHEIRISLGTIQNALQSLTRSSNGRDQQITEILRMAEEEVEGATRTVADFLSLSQGKVSATEEVHW